MSGTSPIAELAGKHIGARTVRYEERDAILYALAVGAQADDLELIYERDLRVLPTYVLALGLWAVEAASRLGSFNPALTVHVGQRLAVRGELPRAGTLATSGRIEAVWDKGTAALVDVAVESPAFEALYTMLVKGAGGWGGPRRSSSSTPEPDGEPVATARVPTVVSQAALYRLTGDRHPIHVDPDVAEAAGFQRPILHGLCTLATVALCVAASTGSAPWELRELEARFAAPVTPGDTLDVAVWHRGEDLAFRADVGDDRVLAAGRARFGAVPSTRQRSSKNVRYQE